MRAPEANITVVMAMNRVVFLRSSLSPRPWMRRRNSQTLSAIAIEYEMNSSQNTGVMANAMKARAGEKPLEIAIAPTTVPVLNSTKSPAAGPMIGMNIRRQMNRLFPKMNEVRAPWAFRVVVVWFRSLLIWFASCGLTGKKLPRTVANMATMKTAIIERSLFRLDEAPIQMALKSHSSRFNQLLRIVESNCVSCDINLIQHPQAVQVHRTRSCSPRVRSRRGLVSSSSREGRFPNSWRGWL